MAEVQAALAESEALVLAREGELGGLQRRLKHVEDKGESATAHRTGEVARLEEQNRALAAKAPPPGLPPEHDCVQILPRDRVGRRGRAAGFWVAVVGRPAFGSPW